MDSAGSSSFMWEGRVFVKRTINLHQRCRLISMLLLVGLTATTKSTAQMRQRVTYRCPGVTLAGASRVGTRTTPPGATPDFSIDLDGDRLAERLIHYSNDQTRWEAAIVSGRSRQSFPVAVEGRADGQDFLWLGYVAWQSRTVALGLFLDAYPDGVEFRYGVYGFSRHRPSVLLQISMTIPPGSPPDASELRFLPLQNGGLYIAGARFSAIATLTNESCVDVLSLPRARSTWLSLGTRPVQPTGGCYAIPQVSFHFRSNASLESSGPELPGETPLVIVAPQEVRRLNSQLYEVQIPSTSQRGFVFVQPSELHGQCSTQR